MRRAMSHYLRWFAARDLCQQSALSAGFKRPRCIPKTAKRCADSPRFRFNTEGIVTGRSWKQRALGPDSDSDSLQVARSQIYWYSVFGTIGNV